MSDITIITLTRGRWALVDAEDFDRVNCFSWQAQQIKNGWIVKRGIWVPAKKNNESQPLSNFILNLPKGVRVDHKSGNPFDNRKENLRRCTKTENDRAFRTKAAGKSSQYRGVSWNKKNFCWSSQIEILGKHMNLGFFECEKAAALTYNDAAIKHFGEFAALNKI